MFYWSIIEDFDTLRAVTNDQARVAVQQTAPDDPSGCPRRDRANLTPVMESWPPAGPQRRPPTYEHLRGLWQLHGITESRRM